MRTVARSGCSRWMGLHVAAASEPHSFLPRTTVWSVAAARTRALLRSAQTGEHAAYTNRAATSSSGWSAFITFGCNALVPDPEFRLRPLSRRQSSASRPLTRYHRLALAQSPALGGDTPRWESASMD